MFIVVKGIGLDFSQQCSTLDEPFVISLEDFANLINTKVHGTADDNVHLTHSMHISKTLIDNGIMFKQMVGINNTINMIML